MKSLVIWLFKLSGPLLLAIALGFHGANFMLAERDPVPGAAPGGAPEENCERLPVAGRLPLCPCRRGGDAGEDRTEAEDGEVISPGAECNDCGEGRRSRDEAEWDGEDVEGAEEEDEAGEERDRPLPIRVIIANSVPAYAGLENLISKRLQRQGVHVVSTDHDFRPRQAVSFIFAPRRVRSAGERLAELLGGDIPIRTHSTATDLVLVLGDDISQRAWPR